MENNLCRVSADSTWQQNSIIDDTSAKESLSLFSPDNECSSSMGGSGASCRSRNGILMEENSKDFGSRHHATIDAGSLSKRKELVPCQADVGHSAVNSCGENAKGIASTSKELQPSESTSTSGDSRLDIATDVEECSQICTDGSCSSSVSQQELGHPYANGLSSVQNETGEIPGIHNSDRSSAAVISDSSLSSGLLGDEPHQEAAPSSSSGFLLPTSRQSELRNGSMLHVEVASISPSSTVEISTQEARQNSRRLFWDAFSRRSSRRNGDSPTIIFSTEDTEDVGSHNRRFLDFNGNLFDDGIGDFGYRSSRGYSPYERRRHSRSEVIFVSTVLHLFFPLLLRSAFLIIFLSRQACVFPFYTHISC